MSSRCNSCPAKVLWLVNDITGKRAPIDAEPTANGNVLPNHEQGTYEIVAPVERHKYAGRLHTSHFVSCPEGPAWKGKRRG